MATRFFAIILAILYLSLAASLASFRQVVQFTLDREAKAKAKGDLVLTPLRPVRFVVRPVGAAGERTDFDCEVFNAKDGKAHLRCGDDEYEVVGFNFEVAP